MAERDTDPSTETDTDWKEETPTLRTCAKVIGYGGGIPEHRDLLSEWEQNFVDDIIRRGRGNLTFKQASLRDRILLKVKKGQKGDLTIEEKKNTAGAAKATKQVLKDLQETAEQSGVMNDWEKGFMGDIIRRGRSLSPAQQRIVDKIMAKVEKAAPADDGSNWWESDEALKILWETDLESDDLTAWEKSFIRDQKNRCTRSMSAAGMSERQRAIVLNIPERMVANAAARAKAAERQALMETITTESGFERVAELMKGALESGLKRPAVTFTVEHTVDDSDRVSELTFRCDAHTPNIIEVKNTHRKGGHVFGIIDITSGDFTYNGLCPDWVVLFTRKVAEDPEAAAVENGFLTGACCFCRIGLHDHRSTAVGYGPICAKHYNLPWSQETYRQRLALRVTKMQAVRSIRDGQDELIHSTETITCGGCGKFALHPIDYERESNRDEEIHTWACNNGCDGHGPYFTTTDEKCDARFVVNTTEFLARSMENITGIKAVEVKRVITAPTGNGERTWDCTCGKVYRSPTGRYNHLKKEMDGCGKTEAV